MKYSLKTFAFFATSAFILLSINTNLFAQKTTKPTKAKTAIVSPMPKVTQIDEIKIKELLKPNGKPLLVNFWATWCVPCREEFPELAKINEEYKDKIDFITISLDDLAEINRDVPKFLTEMKATMPAYLLKTTDESAVISSISKDWEGGLPFSVLYNKDGEMIYFKQGKIKIDVVKEKLNTLLTDIAQIDADQILELPTSHFIYTYEKGMEDATNDINYKKYIVKTYGMISTISSETRKKLAEKYGIKVQGYGCFTNADMIKYIEGYNKISKAEIKRKFGEEL